MAAILTLFGDDGATFVANRVRKSAEAVRALRATTNIAGIGD